MSLPWYSELSPHSVKPTWHLRSLKSSTLSCIKFPISCISLYLLWFQVHLYWEHTWHCPECTPGSSVVNAIKPAYMLSDRTLERAGRSITKKKIIRLQEKAWTKLILDKWVVCSKRNFEYPLKFMCSRQNISLACLPCSIIFWMYPFCVKYMHLYAQFVPL